MKKIILFCLVMVFMLGMVVYAGPKEGGTLEIGLDSDPPMLDPHLSTAKVDRQIFKSLYDSLLAVDRNMKVIPSLVKEWEILDGGLTYIFKLRQDVVFHDGTKFNAEAVKFNFDRMLDPDFGSPRRGDLSMIDKIEVLGNYEVKIILKKPFTPFLVTLADRAGMMVSPAAVKKYGADFANKPVGTGPFKFKKRVVQEKIVLVKNQEYWQEGLPYLDKVVYRPYPDSNVRVINLTSGDLHLIDEVPAKDLNSLKEDPDVTIDMSNGLGFQGIWINKSKEPFSDDALTRALANTINRQAVVKVVFGEAASPADSPFPPGTVMHNEERQTPVADIAAAKKELKSADRNNGFSFNLMVSNSPTSQQVAQLLQSMSSQAGIKINIELLEFGTLLERLSSGNYQAALLGWSGRVDPDGNTYRFFHSEGGLNNSFYYNDEVDKILEKARVVTDVQERKELYKELMVHLDRDLSYIFIYHPKDIVGYKNSVKGFVPYPDGLLRLHKVWLE